MGLYIHANEHPDGKRFGFASSEVQIEYNGRPVLAVLNTVNDGAQNWRYWLVPGVIKGELRGGPQTFESPTTEVAGVPEEEREGLEASLKSIADAKTYFWH